MCVRVVCVWRGWWMVNGGWWEEERWEGMGLGGRGG